MTILEQIVQDTRERLGTRKREVTVSRLEEASHFARRPAEFAAVLQEGRPSVIAEVKRASPSKGIIRKDFDAAEIAHQYADCGAAAVSVLTEPQYFMGSLEDLESVRDTVGVPLLRKDFVIDPYQLIEARAFGADAVLLIAAVLEREHLHDLVQAARELGLTPLVEIYELKELDRVDFNDVGVIGVNNRDLRTFAVDIEHSLRIFRHVPRDVVRVSESGLSTADDLHLLAQNGIDAVLIGEAFMRAERPGDALKELIDGVVRLREVEQDAVGHGGAGYEN